MKPQLVTNLVHESIAAATEGAATGALSVESYFMSIDNSANRKLLDAYTARYSASIGRAVRGKTVVLPMGERTYVSLKIWAEAVRLAGSLDADKIRSAFPQLEIEAPRGSIRIDASGRILCETLLGRVQSDNGIETIARLGRFDAKCIAG
jgi:branched-chain amino acid transport system substrate-binding protein